ncbi:hypothetical protein [Ancylobacter sp. TS-1]|uniref:hypothetical protein n=1 Tax=Ancylobacter sp. TS-1 TaxID=1850374 RepID=UPI001265D63B|nr:hypothetical protein [Ancylobacter sp. TS-1]QFR31680.1 hypothetical protein GBB76_00340 [Ancylobacter sp. TS-1]
MIRFPKSTKLAALVIAGATVLASAVPADAGWRGRGGPGWGGPGWGGPGHYYGPRRNNNGAAIAAGIIGGLAVGALAATAANNYRPRCWTETRTVYNSWGQPYYRDVEVCR